MKLNLPADKRYYKTIDQRLGYTHNRIASVFGSTKEISGTTKRLPYGFKKGGKVGVFVNYSLLNWEDDGERHYIMFGSSENMGFGFISQDSEETVFASNKKRDVSYGTHNIQLSRDLANGEVVIIHWGNGLDIKFCKEPVYNNDMTISGYKTVAKYVKGGSYNELGPEKKINKDVVAEFIVYYSKEKSEAREEASTTKSTPNGDYTITKHYNVNALDGIKKSAKKNLPEHLIYRGTATGEALANKEFASVTNGWFYTCSRDYEQGDIKFEKGVNYAVEKLATKFNWVNIGNYIEYTLTSSNTIINYYDLPEVQVIGEGYNEWVTVDPVNIERGNGEYNSTFGEIPDRYETSEAKYYKTMYEPYVTELGFTRAKDIGAFKIAQDNDTLDLE